MSTHYPLASNFSSGEITPAILARGDLAQYNNGCETLVNNLPLSYGGVRSRPGTKYVGAVHNANNTTVLIPFIYPSVNSYAIEAGDLYFRFFVDKQRVTEAAKNITGCADNGSGVIRVTSNAHGYANGEWVVIENVGGTTEANGVWVVSGATTNTFDLTGSTFTNTYTSGGTAKRVYHIASPYTAAQVAAVRYVQDGKRLFLVHGSHAPRTLTRTGTHTFTLATFAFDGGPYQPLNRTTTTLNCPATTGTGLTLTASASIFNSNMVGMFIRYGGTTGSPAEQGFLKITGYTSGTQVTVDVISTLDGAATPITDWAFGAWGDDPGWPQEAAIVQQRLVLGKTATEPRKASASTIGIFEDFTVSTNADRSFTIDAAANDAGNLKWMFGKKTLLMGTDTGELSVSGGDSGLTPTTATVENHSPWGSNDVRPVVVGNSLLFVNRNGRKLREMSFSLDIDGYDSPDVTLLSRHVIANNPIQQMCYQQESDSIIWMALQDGSMASLTWLKDQKVFAWARHSGQNAAFSYPVSLPNNTAEHDDVYMIVTRTIDGNTVKYVEVFDYDIFVDSAVLGAVGGRTITGLSHLEGETVKIIGDGAVYNDQSVTNGEVTIADHELDITNGVVGLPITSDLLTVEPVVQLDKGTSFGRKKTWPELWVRTVNTTTLTINGEEADARSTDDLMDTAIPVPAFRDFRSHRSGYDNRGRVRIQQNSPLPHTILGIFGTLQVGD